MGARAAQQLGSFRDRLERELEGGEWMLRSGSVEVVLRGLEAGTIRFFTEI